jgi:glycosyltransferase involved in cell wall biosynthesis
MSKNILFVSHSENAKGGAEASLLELMKSAKRRGYQPFLAVPAEGELSQKARSLGIHYLATPYCRWGTAGKDLEKLADLNAASRIAQFISESNVGCVISNTLIVPWGALGAALANVPHVWIAREFFAHHRSYLFEHYEFINVFSSVVIANSKSNSDYLRDVVGLKVAKNFHSYVELDDIKLSKEKSAPKIVCIGIIHPDKNQLEVIEAAAELKKQKKLGDVRVEFFGRHRDDGYFHTLQAAVAKNKLTQNIVFRGFVENPYLQIGENDILVQPSKHESLGRTITEAMKLGLICVGADIPGTSEAIGLGGGNLYKSGDPHDLAKTLAEIMAEPQAYRARAQKAQKRALANLSEAASHQPFFDALETALGQPNPRGELRHLQNHFESLLQVAERLRQAEEKAEKYQKVAEERRVHIESIRNSRTWKALVMAGNVRSLPKRLLGGRGSSKGAIHFVYIERRKDAGSTVMRGEQLAHIAQQHLPDQKIFYSPLDLECKNAMLFLTKWTLAGLKPEYLERLKKNHNVLIFDPVDSALPDFTKDYADFVVAASKTAFSDYQKVLPREKVRLVNHHVDPRIRFDKARQPKILTPGYFGEKVNAFKTPAIEALVEFVQVDTSQQKPEWLNNLSNYNLHYAVRQLEQKDNHKPFLKGFTAAHCHSNVLIQDSQEEAVLWLGHEYPYLLKGEVTEAKILEKLRHMKESYGSREWKQALDTMARIRKQTSNEAICEQLAELFRDARSQIR